MTFNSRLLTSSSLPRPLRILLPLAAALLLYLAGNGRVALWDRDEPRYAQCSRQMLQSGDWVVPHLYDQVRYAKPPLTYWLQATAMRFLGDTAFAARLPSALAMTATLAVLYLVLRPSSSFGIRHSQIGIAGWTPFILATAALPIAAAKMCLTDATLLFFTTISQFALYLILTRRPTWPTILTYAVATALAGLTKGPVVLGIQATTAAAFYLLAFHRRSSEHSVGQTFPSASDGGTPPSELSPQSSVLSTFLKPLAATAIIALIVAPWLLLVTKRQPDFLSTSLSHDVLQRMKSGLEGHSAPPGYYLLTVWGTYFPWSILLPGALVLAWKHRHLPLIRFSLAAAVGPWVMFELIRTKLPHYVLPTFPFLALLTADALVRAFRNEHPAFSDKPFRVVATVIAALLATAAALPWLAAAKFPVPQLPTTILTATILAYAICLVRAFARGHLKPAAVTMGLGFAAVVLVLYTVYLPSAQFLRLSPRIAAAMKDLGATTPGDEIMIDYKEPSLAFHQGGTLREAGDGYLAATPPARWPHWIVLTQTLYDTLPQNRKDHLEVLQSFHGLAYADSARTVDVLLARKR